MKKKILALILGITVLGSTIGASVLHAQGTASLSIAGEDTLDGSAIDVVSTLEQSEDKAFSYSNVADVAEAVMPSIVAITNKSVQEVRSFFYGTRPFQYESESAGSGIIVGSNDTELLICTNNHVVEDASELTVSFIDDESYSAIIKGTDPSNDLAVVAVKLEDISEDTKGKIRIASIGDSDSMRVGEQVVAIGNALGYGQSVTTGIISAKDRSINVGGSDGYSGGFGGGYGYGFSTQESNSEVYENLIQTDAAINPGNSGGALLDMSGNVIGINSAKASSSGVEGMGYAIPISKAMPILNDLMSRVSREKVDDAEMGYMGITGQSVSNEAVLLYGIPAGVYLTSVTEDSPAAQAGLKEGSIITKFDGYEITSFDDLDYRLQYYKAGETIDITVAEQNEGRQFEERTVSLTLGTRPSMQ